MQMMLWRLPLIIVQWTLSAILKLVLLPISGLAVVLSVMGDGWKRTPKLFKWAADGEMTPARWYSRWGVAYYWAIRNPVKCMVLPKVPLYKLREYGEIDESKPGFQWRYRWAGYLDSFRIVWGEPHPHKGKKEFYIGWKIGSPSPNKFTIQFRPF